MTLSCRSTVETSIFHLAHTAANSVQCMKDFRAPSNSRYNEAQLASLVPKPTLQTEITDFVLGQLFVQSAGLILGSIPATA